MRTVVVSGIGVVSPVGTGVAPFWEALNGGASGIAPQSDAAIANVARVAARVTDFAAGDYIKDARLRRVCNRAFEMLASAAVLAWEDGDGQRLAARSARIGVSVGIGPIDQYTEDLRRAVGRSIAAEAGRVDLGSFADAARQLHPLRRLQYLPNIGAAVVSILHQATGPTLTFVSGVAAGLQAICAAVGMIRDGRADAVLCGGVDARLTPRLAPTAADQFQLSTVADPERACRPFDRSHSGVVLGEGASMLLLEAEDLSPARRDSRYATVMAYRMFRAHDCARVVGRMLDESGVDSPDLVVAHGDGGVASDECEVRALAALFGDAPVAPSITSIQPAIGHTLCAAGPFAAAAACLSVSRGAVPPIRSLADPIAPLSFVTGHSCVRKVRSAVANCIDAGRTGGALLVAQHP